MSFLICEYCADSLNEISPVMYQTYLEICANYSNGIISKIDEEDNPGLKGVIKYLEEKRYIFTVDTDSLISVIPRGRFKIKEKENDNNIPFFCICRKRS